MLKGKLNNFSFKGVIEIQTSLDTVDEEAAKAAIGVEIGCLYESEREAMKIKLRSVEENRHRESI